MAVTVRIPTQLRTLTQGVGEVSVEGDTVGAALRALEASYPGFAERILDEEGSLRRFVNVFVADEDVRFLQGLDTVLTQGQIVSILPAVAGGDCTTSTPFIKDTEF
ncbi:MAG: MoaD/ThiS family protein [Actinobacteria bacterium]|nr:MoaD/ThiS family protein [Actinomycetota bacterium]MCL6104886.1 MoaD/ThiS family protein [Actinomycetota bacterium]